MGCLPNMNMSHTAFVCRDKMAREDERNKEVFDKIDRNKDGDVTEF